MADYGGVIAELRTIRRYGEQAANGIPRNGGSTADGAPPPPDNETSSDAAGRRKRPCGTVRSWWLIAQISRLTALVKLAWLFIGPVFKYLVVATLDSEDPDRLQSRRRRAHCCLGPSTSPYRLSHTECGPSSRPGILIASKLAPGPSLTALVSEYEPALLLLPFVVVVTGLYEVFSILLPALAYPFFPQLFKWYNRAAKAGW
ncbi:hypothetical protein B0H17DRAFT_1337779 [Mycena rosella]|uniref:Uncharacterized protein n=1 Tax=Mycena rosella TaxID=1033263 RepID=A0AAD7CQG5_MYCRO|nr:hypothetical protein B0H17DRAFT_1337779 [Mycena rosella]